ncbi:MAG: L17 family ribosomal protein [Candidatus Dojkabacteria bacterium]|jgi:large subunit ribosomal protein L17|nr:L17 family ribosomal protein [Candidatus Dojkabacteria bacterium]
MYKRNSIKKLGRTTSHRKALIQNQLRSLVESGKIKTTSPKAKVMKGEIESLISKVRTTKDGDLSLRRKLLIVFGNTELVNRFVDIAKKDSAKVLIKKVGFRDGDNAQVSVLEIKGLKVKGVKKVGKTKDEPKEVEEKKPVIDEEKKKGILGLGSKKSVTKGVGPINKERAKSRSGL